MIHINLIMVYQFKFYRTESAENSKPEKNNPANKKTMFWQGKLSCPSLHSIVWVWRDIFMRWNAYASLLIKSSEFDSMK